MKMTKRVTIDGRLFQIDFWTDTSLGVHFPYYAVEEIKTRRRKRFFLFGDYIECEFHIPVSEHWTPESRVEHAQADIRSYLDNEKKELSEALDVINFCKTQAIASNERNVNGQ